MMSDTFDVEAPVILVVQGEDEPVGRAKLRLKLDVDAPNGVSFDIVDPDWDEEPDGPVQAHFTSALYGIAFMAALDPAMIGKDC